MNEQDTIYCIGDSHVSFFSGIDKIQNLWPFPVENKIPFFKTFRLGAVLADSLSRYGSTMKGRELLFVLVNREVMPEFRAIPPKSKILFCFGEIDCRFHIIKHAEKKGVSIENIASETASRYANVLMEVQNLGYEILVWNVIPPTNPITSNPEYPHYGDYSQRITATESFNQQLETDCKKNNFVFFNVYNALIDGKHHANMEYYMDQVHLSQAAMPLVIKELKKKYPDLKEFPVARRTLFKKFFDFLFSFKTNRR